MTGFDAILILMAVAILLYEVRLDAGLGLLDAVATLFAAHGSRLAAPLVTEVLRWKPFPGTELSPLAQGITFLVLWVAALAVARLLHRQTRWSMDQWDPAFGLVFGLIIALTAGHITTAVVGSHEMMVHRKLPGYFANSLLGEELRSFPTYHYVVDTLRAAQTSR